LQLGVAKYVAIIFL